MFLQDIKPGRPDEMHTLKLASDADTHPDRVDLGIGVYRNEEGLYHELQALKQAKEVLREQNPSHLYGETTGNRDFLDHAAKVVFGDDSEALKSGKIASAQAISGTGSIHLGAAFLAHVVSNMPKVAYVGTPTWGNYVPMFTLLGFDVRTYPLYDKDEAQIDFDTVLEVVSIAPRGSTFILQACCHNPTATELSREQWHALAAQMKARELFPLFDVAYQGLGAGLEEDAYGLRHCVEQGLEMMVCQSFSKSFGLYGERVGALHVVCPSAEASTAVLDQLRCLIRQEISATPLYGSRLVNIVLSDQEKKALWVHELGKMRERVRNNRQQLFELLIAEHKTPGNWDRLAKGTGLFTLLPLSPAQCKALQTRWHIYIVGNGRLNLSGLSDRNINYVARAIDDVIQNPDEL
ncbi:aspartate aminotransferase [Xylariales sp. PMI_506]|nr:aspartate aminotransferase [Xylariales sp. PMI_506]